MRLRAAVLAALLAFPGGAALAGPVHANDPDSVLQAIRSYGHNAKLDSNAQGQPFITVERDGVRYWVYFYACDGADGCLDLQFFTTFDVQPALDAQWANDWNYQWAAGRVEVDERGDPGLSYFVTTMGGLSPENFTGVMDVWTAVLDGFMEDIDWP
jgi:hypothetical protein